MKALFAVFAAFATIWFVASIANVGVSGVEVEPNPHLPGQWQTAYNLIDDSRSVEDNCLLVAAYMARHKDELPALPTEGTDKFEKKLGTFPRFTMKVGFARVVVPDGVTLEVTVKTCEDDVFIQGKSVGLEKFPTIGE